MRADILPTKWPRHRISDYERVFHYRLMVVIRRALLLDATCHALTPGLVNSMCSKSADDKHREWIKDAIHLQEDAQIR